MTELNSMKCIPCEGGIEPLTPGKAHELVAQLHADWDLTSDASAIRREFRFKDFYRTMSFVNALAHIANLEDHHPDLEVGYGVCRVLYTTHAIKGLSENDFICAAKIDCIPIT